MSGRKNQEAHGFALIEVLVALAILSIVLISVFGAVMNGITVLRGSGNFIRAMIICRSSYHQFTLDRMRGADVHEKPVVGYDGFYVSRITERFEHPLLGALPARKTTFTVTWREQSKERHYSASMVYYR